MIVKQLVFVQNTIGLECDMASRRDLRRVNSIG